MIESILAELFEWAGLLLVVVVSGVGAVIAFQRRARHPWVSRVVIIACVSQAVLTFGSRFIWPAISDLANGSNVDFDRLSVVFALLGFLFACLYTGVFGLLIWAALAGRVGPQEKPAE